MNEQKIPFLKRVVLRNYKSIQECDVSLGSLMLLVGPNGSGKSNFLDALRFVADSLRSTMDQALRERGGIEEVRRKSRGHPNHFMIQLELNLPEETKASYQFLVRTREGCFRIQEEKCTIGNGNKQAEYWIQEGVIKSSSFHPTPPVKFFDTYHRGSSKGAVLSRASKISLRAWFFGPLYTYYAKKSKQFLWSEVFHAGENFTSLRDTTPEEEDLSWGRKIL